MGIFLSDLYKHLKISEKAIQKIEDIRHSEPVRKVGSKVKNVSGVYPSKKMGLTIQFESRTLELAGIYEKEFDKEVIEYYDQPSTFTIRYEHKGKNLGHAYTPDFFVIENDWIGWEEWKKEEEMPRLLEKFPNRYHLDEMGVWHCPPAEKYAEQFGLSFRMRISNEINWTYQRNLRFLEDYLLEDHPSVNDQSKYIILCLVRENPGISLESLINLQAGFTSDDIYALIATSEIYVELDHYLITEFDQFPLYLNKEVAETFRNISFANREDIYNTGIITVTPGQVINWGGNQCTVVNVGESEVTILNGEQLVPFPHAAFEQLIQRGLIKSVSDLTEVKDNEVLIDLISSASPDELSKANVKYQLLQQYWAGNQNIETPARTLRYWDKQYRDAEELYVDGYAGLLSSKHKQGNRKRKLDPNVIALMEEYINNRYENKKMSNVKSVYRLFEAECLKRGYDTPSYRTFVTAVSRRPKYEQENKRKGPKSAYKYEQFYYYLEETTPKHGERPFEICHLDHTELDIELRCSETNKNLGKPWVSFLVDAYSRRLLAFYLTFDAPSYRSNMMVMRECVKKHSRLPDLLVVDGGKDFHSVYFDTLLAKYRITKETRPGAKPRFGSVCERLFGTANTEFINNLIGNTQIMKNVREVTKKYQPKNQAIWTFEAFYEGLNQWAYEIYDKQPHVALNESPSECFINRIYKTGDRASKYIAYDKVFTILTLPATKKGTAKVYVGQGIRMNNIYYWSDAFKDPNVEGSQVFVRYDPFDMSVAYAYVKNRWIKLRSEYELIFRNRTEKEIKMASEELRKRKKVTAKDINISGRALAGFLETTEAKELLLMQRLKDNAVHNSLYVIEGGKNKIAKQEEKKVMKKNNSEQKQTSAEHTKIPERQFRVLGEF